MTGKTLSAINLMRWNLSNTYDKWYEFEVSYPWVCVKPRAPYPPWRLI